MKRSLQTISLALFASAMMLAPALASRPRPPAPPRPPHHGPLAPADSQAPAEPGDVREVRSELKASTERAERDLRVQVEKAIHAWLADSGVPSDWELPRRLVDRMIVGKTYVEPVKAAGEDMFRAAVDVDFSKARKHKLVETFRRHEGGHRLAVIGGGLAFVLACLAGVSGYIRADEATKGYYTNRLRLLAAAGVGAAGVAVYRVLT